MGSHFGSPADWGGARKTGFFGHHLGKRRKKGGTEAVQEKNTKVCRNLKPKVEASGPDNTAPVRYLLRFKRFRLSRDFHEKRMQQFRTKPMKSEALAALWPGFYDLFLEMLAFGCFLDRQKVDDKSGKSHPARPTGCPIPPSGAGFAP